MFKKLAMCGLAAVVMALGLIGTSSRSASPAHAEPLNALFLNQETCFLIGTAFAGGTAIECAATNPATFSLNIQNLANRLAKRPLGDPTPPSLADFKGIDLDVNQVHETDGIAFVAVFLNDTGPIDITVTNGTILPTNAGAPVGDHFRCDFAASSGTTPGGDPDCVNGSASADGVYVFAVRADAKSVRGPGRVTVVQERVPLDINFTVVGEPDEVSITVLKTTLQVGASDTAGTLPFTGDDCRLATSASGFLDANGTPERTVAVAFVRDSDGTPISGAGVVWEWDDPDIARTATDFTPTIDLGSFGVGAPEILCGTKFPGNTTIRVRTVAKGPAGPVPLDLPIDLAAPERRASKDITVLGFPASLALKADPATLDCDGKATSTVSATVITAEGQPVLDGNNVSFDVQALGTANPINTKTKGGVATSVISPLQLNEMKGVTVNVSAVTGKTINPVSGIRKDDVLPLESGIFIACTGAGVGAVPPPAPAGASPGGGTGGARGGISGPDTGSGGAEGAGALAWWPLLMLGLGAVGLAGGRLLTQRD